MGYYVKNIFEYTAEEYTNFTNVYARKTSHKMVITVLFYSHTVQEQAFLILFFEDAYTGGRKCRKRKRVLRDQVSVKMS